MNLPQEKNWWERNWKWFVPVGCLGVMVMVMSFVAVILWFVFTFMKSSDVYKEAVAVAKTHPAVVKRIGSPIEEGLFITGNININGPSGAADIAIPISGPDDEATIYAVATKSAGRWTFSTLLIEVEDTKERIDLLE